MSMMEKIDAYGELIEPATLMIRRTLPGPIERVWEYLTKSELRSQWLAAGDMVLAQGAPFELVWRNDNISDAPSQRPADFPEEQRMASRVIECDAPRKLVFTWGDRGAEVTFQLAEAGSEVIFTIIHRRIADRSVMLMVSAGWHAHVDTLVAAVNGRERAPFWERWLKLKEEYDARLPQ